MFARYLSELGSAGESAAQFLALYKRLISTGHWKYYLALKGIITDIGNLITKVAVSLYTYVNDILYCIESEWHNLLSLCYQYLLTIIILFFSGNSRVEFVRGVYPEL